MPHSDPHRPAPRLAVVGFGNMGAAVVTGAVAAAVLHPADVLVVELDGAKRAEATRLGCRVTADPMLARAATNVLLAVKPQSFPELASGLAGRPGRTVFISLMAGLSGDRILGAVGGSHAVVRAMPNTPCKLGVGMTAIALSRGATPGDANFAEQLFGSVGQVVRVEESLLDAVTAVSASGPAYLFLLAEAWEAAAREVGFDPETSRDLVRQTIFGAATMLLDRDVDAAELRAAVTSKGGTTAAALAVLEARDLRGTLRDAIVAARDRGRELGAR